MAMNKNKINQIEKSFKKGNFSFLYCSPFSYRYLVELSLLISFVDWFMASFLYCFPYSCRSFTFLKALAKSNCNLFAIAFKSEKELQLSLSRQLEERLLQKESHQKRSKELIPKSIKSDNFTRSNREESNIAFAKPGSRKFCDLGFYVLVPFPFLSLPPSKKEKRQNKR